MTNQKPKAHKFKNIPKKEVGQKEKQKSKEKIVFEQKKRKKQFPNYYRSITEPISHFKINKRTMIVFSMVILLLAICVASLRLFYIITKEQIAVNKTQVLTKKMVYWEGIVNVYPNYADGYVQLASVSYGLGDKRAAVIYIQKAQNLDPNNLEIQQVEKIIEE